MTMTVSNGRTLFTSFFLPAARVRYILCSTKSLSLATTARTPASWSKYCSAQVKFSLSCSYPLQQNISNRKNNSWRTQKVVHQCFCTTTKEGGVSGANTTVTNREREGAELIKEREDNTKTLEAAEPHEQLPNDVSKDIEGGEVSEEDVEETVGTEERRLSGDIPIDSLRVVQSSSLLVGTTAMDNISGDGQAVSSGSPLRSRQTVLHRGGVRVNEQVSSYKVFRDMAPYIAVHYDSVIVLHIPGEVLESALVDQTMHDIVLLKTLGVKLVLVAGCRPQIKKRLQEFGVRSFFVQGSRVCDYETLKHCQSVAGSVRVEIESKLGRGLFNAPLGTGVGTVQVLSGNFVKAIPYGVRGGIDFKYTGVVQRVAAKKILTLLDQGDIVLLGHLGYSQSGQVFHCRSEEVAVRTAIDLKADKLLFFHNGETLIDISKGNKVRKANRNNAVVHNLSLKVAQEFAAKLRSELDEKDYRIKHTDIDPLQEWKVQFLDYLVGAISAVSRGVGRVHLISRHIEGALITELCTRDGLGLMISYNLYDGVRRATTKDIPALLNLVKPLEQQGILVTRPPELFELEINHFFVFERDGTVLACFQYVNYDDRRYKNGASEMSCVAVSPALQREGIGNALLSYCLRKALSEGVHNIFVLTTRSSHWFIDRGFKERPPEALPPKKYQTYDFKRNPKVYFKTIESEKQISQEEIMWSHPQLSQKK